MLKTRIYFLIVEENQGTLLELGVLVSNLFWPPAGSVWAPRRPSAPTTAVSAHPLSIKVKSDLVRGGFDLKRGLQRGKGAIVSDSAVTIVLQAPQ